MGNRQVRFLEGWAPAMAPGYSTKCFLPISTFPVSAAGLSDKRFFAPPLVRTDSVARWRSAMVFPAVTVGSDPVKDVTCLSVHRARRLLRVHSGPHPQRRLQDAPGTQMKEASSKTCGSSADHRIASTYARPTRLHELRKTRS